MTVSWWVPVACGVAVSCGGASRRVDTRGHGPEVVIPDVTPSGDRPGADDSTPLPSMRERSSAADEHEPGEARGGPDCERAAACCLEYLKQMQAHIFMPDVLEMCDSIRSAPTALCPELLEGYRKNGVTCP